MPRDLGCRHNRDGDAASTSTNGRVAAVGRQTGRSLSSSDHGEEWLHSAASRDFQPKAGVVMEDARSVSRDMEKFDTFGDGKADFAEPRLING